MLTQPLDAPATIPLLYRSGRTNRDRIDDPPEKVVGPGRLDRDRRLQTPYTAFSLAAFRKGAAVLQRNPDL